MDDFRTLVELWHGNADEGDSGYQSVMLAIRVAELTGPPSFSSLVRKFYPATTDTPPRPHATDWSAIPPDAKRTLETAFRWWRERGLQETKREEVEEPAA